MACGCLAGKAVVFSEIKRSCRRISPRMVEQASNNTFFYGNATHSIAPWQKRATFGRTTDNTTPSLKRRRKQMRAPAISCCVRLSICLSWWFYGLVSLIHTPSWRRSPPAVTNKTETTIAQKRKCLCIKKYIPVVASRMDRATSKLKKKERKRHIEKRCFCSTWCCTGTPRLVCRFVTCVTLHFDSRWCCCPLFQRHPGCAAASPACPPGTHSPSSGATPPFSEQTAGDRSIDLILLVDWLVHWLVDRWLDWCIYWVIMCRQTFTLVLSSIDSCQGLRASWPSQECWIVAAWLFFIFNSH